MPSDETLEVWRERLTSVEVAAVAAIVCAVSWTVALTGLLAAPGVSASEAHTLAFYARADATSSMGLNLALMTLGTIGFLWFTGVVRDRLGRHERRRVDTVFVSGSVLMAGLMLVGAAASRRRRSSSRWVGSSPIPAPRCRRWRSSGTRSSTRPARRFVPQS